MATPVLWLGGSALLAHTVLVLLGYVLTALGMYVLVTKWTGDYRAGLLSGALFAFSTALMTRTAHVQGIHVYWLPLAFLAFQRLMEHRRLRDTAWLGLCVIGAALTSGYLVAFVFFALGAAALVRANEFWGRDGARLLLRLGLAAVVTVAILLVVLRPYLQAGYQRPPVGRGDRTGDGAGELSGVCRDPALPELERGLLPLVAGYDVSGLRDVHAGNRRRLSAASHNAARRSPHAPGGRHHRFASVARLAYPCLHLGQ